MVFTLKTVAATVACLAATTLALPTSSQSSNLVSRQEHNCEIGTWYYTCSNGHEGCYSYDPCWQPGGNGPKTDLKAEVSEDATSHKDKDNKYKNDKDRYNKDNDRYKHDKDKDDKYKYDKDRYNKDNDKYKYDKDRYNKDHDRYKNDKDKDDKYKYDKDRDDKYKNDKDRDNKYKNNEYGTSHKDNDNKYKYDKDRDDDKYKYDNDRDDKYKYNKDDDKYRYNKDDDKYKHNKDNNDKYKYDKDRDDKYKHDKDRDDKYKYNKDDDKNKDWKYKNNEYGTSKSKDKSKDKINVCKAGKIWEPVMWNLLPESPTTNQAAVSRFEVQVLKGKPSIQQAIVFTGIPSTAKECTLKWAQNGAPFKVEKNGLVRVTQLSGFPSDRRHITFNSVRSFESKTTASADFTNWDVIKESRSHTVGPFKCAPNMWFKVQIDDRNHDGRVLLEQDENDGWYIDYKC